MKKNGPISFLFKTSLVSLLKTYLAIFFCFCALHFVAQETTVKGQIIDSHSAEPIPFATISILNTTIGESSDFDGNFEMIFSDKPDSLLVSALGYSQKIIPYEGQLILNIKLDASDYSLEEIVVRPTEDPAVVLFKKILEHKPKNNPNFLPQYSCEIYDKLELDLVHVTEGFQDFWLNRPFKFAFQKIDSLSEDEPFLPVFLTEKLSDFQYIKQPKTELAITKASKVSGFQNAGIEELLDVLYQNINIYEEWIPILTKDFASPISDAGFNYYNYYLVDSATINKQWCYQVQFFPKSKSSPTFSGNFWVENSSYAIKRVNLNLFKNADLNFVEKMNIVQVCAPFEDGFWQPIEAHTTVTFDKVTKPLMLDWFSKKIENNSPSIQGKRSTSFQKYNQNLLEKTKQKNTSLEKEEAFWIENRHIELTEKELEIHQLIDTIQELPVFNSWKRWTTLIFSGYIPLGVVDVGNFYSFYSKRPIENKRFKIGLRTNSKLSKKWLLGTYLAYGTADKRFKFGINSLYLFQSSPRRFLSGTMIHDIVQNPNLNSNFGLSSEGVLASDFIRQSSIPFKLLDIKNYQLNYFQEQNSGFSWKISTENQWTKPYFDFEYQTGPDDLFDNPTIDQFKHSTASLLLRYAYKEKFLSGVFNRASLGSRFPILTLEYKIGLRGVLGGDFNFQKLDFTFFDRIDLAPIGYFKTNINAGKVWGRLPYFLLHTPKGNEGFFSNFDGFNLIPNFSFAADSYVRASVDHHFDGFIFKKLPLLKKLKIRTVANYRILWGDLSSENRTANASSLFENTTVDNLVRLRVPKDIPYMETSVGIENILKVLRLDFVWKLNYKESDTQNWGLRANLHLKF